MPNRKPLRIVSILLIAGLGSAALVGAAVVFVVPGVVERLVLAELGAAGLDEAELSVREVGWTSARIGDVRIGDDLTIDDVDIAYTVPDLLAGRLRRVVVSGLRLAITATGEGVSLGALEPLLEPANAESSPPPSIPVETIELRDARIDVATPAGVVAITVSAELAVSDGRRVHGEGDVGLRAAWGSARAGLTLDAEVDGRLDARLRIAEGELSVAAIRLTGLGGDIALGGNVAAVEAIEARLSAAEVVVSAFALADVGIDVMFAGDRLSATASARSVDAQIAFTATATVDDVAGPMPGFALESEITVADASALQRLLPSLPPFLSPAAGRGRATVAISGVVPELARLASVGGPRDWLGAVALNGEVGLGFDDLDLPGLAAAISAAGRAAFDLSAGRLTVASADGVAVAVARLDPAVLEALGPGSPLRPLAEGPITLDIGGAGRVPISLDARVEGDAYSVRGAAGARLALSAGPAVDIGFDAAATIDANGAIRSFTVSPLTVAANGLELADMVLAEASLRLDLAGAPAAFGGGARVRLDVARATLSQVAVRDARFVLDGDLALRDARLTVTLRDGGEVLVGGLRIADNFEATEPVTVVVEGSPDPALEVTLDPDGVVVRHRLGLAATALAGTLALPEGIRAAVRVDAPHLRLDGEARWPGGYAGTVTLRDGGEVRIGGLRIADNFEATEPVTVVVEGSPDPALEVTLDSDGVVVRHRLGLAVAALAGTLALPEETRAAVRIEATHLRLDGEAHWPAGGYEGTVTLLDGGEVGFGGLRIAEIFEATEPVTVVVDGSPSPALEVKLDRDGVVVRHRLGLAVAAAEGTLALTEGSRAAVQIEAPHLRLDGEARWPGGYAGTATVADGRLRLPDHGVTVEGIDVTIDAGARERALASFSVRALRQEPRPPYVVPLRLEGRAELVDDRLALSGRVGDANGRLVIEASGVHDFGRDGGRAALKLHRLSFAPEVLRPEDLFPILRGTVSEVSGAVAAEGEVAWSGSALSTDIEVLIDDVSLWAGRLRLQRVNSVIELDRLWPPSTPPAQVVAVGLLDAGIPLTDGVITFDLVPEGRLDIERAVWRWAGGTIGIGAVSVGPNATRHDLEMEVADIDLAEIVELADIDGVAATGRLSGRIPVAVSEAGIVVRDGWLEAAPGGGTVRYAPSAVPPALRQAGESATLMLTALENFHYESLRITLDRQIDGAAAIGLHLRGANPDFYDGYPIEFNLTVGGELDAMLRSGLEGYRIPDAIRERLQGFGS